MDTNRIMIIGLGQVGKELLKRLSRDIDITCIEINPDKENILKELRREDVRLIIGDASSRLVLEDAEVDDSDAVIITTRDERVNIEIATVLKEHFRPRMVISIAHTQKGIETLEGLGVEVENIFATSAMGIRNRIERQSKAAHAIGIGKDEILEVEVHPNSRLANKSLGFIDPIRWRVGIIYRSENIIFPRPDTIMKPKDKVIILGDPSVLKTVSEILTFSPLKFPQEYGPSVLLCFSGKEDATFINEVNYLFTTFPLEKAIAVYPINWAADKREELLSRLEISNIVRKETLLSPFTALQDEVKKSAGEHGLIILPNNVLRPSLPSVRGTGRKRALQILMSIAKCPVLVSRGTFPYEKIAVPCVGNTDVEHIMQTAFEISSSINSQITTFHVSPSRYIADEDELNIFEDGKKAALDMSLIYRSKVRSEVLKGNPIKAVLQELDGHNLLIADMSGLRKQGWLLSVLNPDEIWNIIRNAPVTSLIIPPLVESL